MKLILCHSILKREIEPLLEYFSKGDLKKAVLKVKNGLGAQLKSSAIPNSKLIKVYLTGERGAGRLVVLVLIKQDYYVPVILRLKKNKMVGSNVGKGNPAFTTLLDKSLDLILSDLRKGDFEQVDV